MCSPQLSGKLSNDLDAEEREDREHMMRHFDKVEAEVQNLNTPQKSAIVHCLRGSQRLCLLQGPPGTGKSHTVSTMVRGLLHGGLPKGRLIMVTATSNKAVLGLLERCLQEMQGLMGRHAFKAKVVFAGVEDQLPEMSISSFNSNLSARDVYLHKPVEAALTRIDFMLKNMQEPRDRAEVSMALTEIIERLSARATSLKDVLQPMHQRILKNNSDIKPCIVDMKSRLAKLSNKQLEAIENETLQSTDVIFCTLATAGRPRLQQQLQRRRVAFAIMDEAAQSIEGDTMLMLPYLPQRMLLVGDLQQLSATVASEGSARRCWDRSLMQRLFAISADWPMLEEQHRMAPEIACFPSKAFYQKRLQNAQIVHQSTALDCRAMESLEGWSEDGEDAFEKLPRYLFVDVQGSEASDASKGLANDAEAKLAVSIAERLLKSSGITSSTKICLLTFYQKQRQNIDRKVKHNLSEYSFSGQLQVHTVDSYQGSEADVVILSGVRTSRLGFLRDHRRLNVAITRARRRLFVLGSASCLRRMADTAHCKHVRRFINNAEKRNLMIPAELLRAALQDH